MAGGNSGKQAQARSRREAREQLAALAEAIDAERLYQGPPADECVKDPSEVFLDRRNRLHLTLYFHDGRLVRFFFAWQTLEREEWVERYSVCAQHGWLHEHKAGHQLPDDRENLQPLYSQVDVQELHDRAYDMVHNRFQLVSGGGQYE